MADYTTVIPGVPGGALTTDYPIHVRILPASQTINRPGFAARTPRRSVQHGNGNPNAYAASDSLWLYNGARGANGLPTQTSFHADGDHTGVWFNIPANEVTWQAADGGGPGNYNGFSCEMSEHSVYRTNMDLLRRNIYVNADFMGRVAGARLGAGGPEQHWSFNYRIAGCSAPCDVPAPNRHNCPNILRTMTIDGRSAWSIYAAQWAKSKADELQRMRGTQPKPPPKAPKPVLFDWWEHGVRTKTNQHGTNHTFFQYAVIPLTVMEGRTAQRYPYPDPKAKPVAKFRGGWKMHSLYWVRLSQNWVSDDEGWWYKANVFAPKMDLPFPPGEEDANASAVAFESAGIESDAPVNAVPADVD